MFYNVYRIIICWHLTMVSELVWVYCLFSDNLPYCTICLWTLMYSYVHVLCMANKYICHFSRGKGCVLFTRWGLSFKWTTIYHSTVYTVHETSRNRVHWGWTRSRPKMFGDDFNQCLHVYCHGSVAIYLHQTEALYPLFITLAFEIYWTCYDGKNVY